MTWINYFSSDQIYQDHDWKSQRNLSQKSRTLYRAKSLGTFHPPSIPNYTSKCHHDGDFADPNSSDQPTIQ
ncbi:hypothetical protein WN48_06364 [Eufriesea mexicana]|uniref:Uncharacterized protein n=1 Tax=Eufriesea mexicana TaxID=516756 RepID=A0A310SCT4_9HYME|nr:hypothetical protein WN48_06364 [Eufriesea mexicana]